MKTKYVVNYGDNDYIFNDRTDAEEFVLSLAEDQMYLDACFRAHITGSFKSWFNWYRKRLKEYYLDREFFSDGEWGSFEGYLFWDCIAPNDFTITEAVAFED